MLKGLVLLAGMLLPLVAWTQSAAPVPKPSASQLLTPQLLASQLLAPKRLAPGTLAPELKFAHLLQAPAQTRVDWAAFRGKAVVLEFWATWCVPCVAQIPAFNALAASLDPAKVQFISIDEEDPAVVQLFLKKRLIAGWFGFEDTGALQQAYGVEGIPATIVIDPQGRIALTSEGPEGLTEEQLLAVADGGKAPLPSTQNAPAQSSGVKTTASAEPVEEDLALLEIVLSKGVSESGSRNIFEGPQRFDLANVTVAGLLRQALDVPESRITSAPDLLVPRFDLHVKAAGIEPSLFRRAVEDAIAAGVGVHIEHHVASTTSYVLRAGPEAKGHFSVNSAGFAMYQPKVETMVCRSASVAKIAATLEQVLGMPVVDETGLTGQATATFKMSKDLPSIKAALTKELGLTLEPGERPIETLTLTR